MKYLKEFATETAYNTYITGEAGDVYLPNVSLTNDDNIVHFNNKHDYSKDYFTVVASSAGEFKWQSSLSNAYASIDGGNTWTELTGTTFTHPAGKILFKATSCFESFRDDYAFAVEGNIMSLIYGDNFTGQTTPPSSAFASFFQTSNKLTDASNLILPAKVSFYCYDSMFNGCVNLKKAPELPATTLKPSCYTNMFRQCAILNSVTCHATDISASSCLTNWLLGVAASGTFKCVNGVNYPSGNSGIPTGWTRVDI